jgi:glycosyltransferase involved in cell wall biosynthesis
MKISIVIPVYERPDKETVLKRCLDSIAIQSFKDYEIVMPENGKGWSANHNQGIRESKGEFIKFLHMDDFFSDNFSLQELVNNLKDGVNWLVTGCGHTYDGTEWINPHFARWNNKMYTGNNTIGAPSVLTIRNEDPLFFDERLSWVVDCDYYQRLYERYGKPFVLDNINVIIGLSPNQATNNISEKAKREEVEYLIKNYA